LRSCENVFVDWLIFYRSYPTERWLSLIIRYESIPPFLPPSLPSFLPRTEGTSLSPLIPHQRPPPLPPSLPPSSQLCEIYRALALGTAEFETEAPLELVKVREGGREGGRERGKFGLPDNLSVL